MNKIILATGNKGKIAEFCALLAPTQCISQHDIGILEPEETGLSFVENALLKARHASALANKPALADDSGLVVPALDGAPGIYSARYAGNQATDDDNIKLLLKNMTALSGTDRHAYFYCALVMVQHAKDPAPLIALGTVNGSIHTTPLGEDGFGYDPIFWLEEQQCTMAQVSKKIKNTISHRAQALKQLLPQIG